MKIITKRRINKAVDELVDAVFDHVGFDVEVNGYHDYDVNLYVSECDKPEIATMIYEILTDKKPRKHWKLINIAVRKTK